MTNIFSQINLIIFPCRYNTALQYLDGLLAVEPQKTIFLTMYFFSDMTNSLHFFFQISILFHLSIYSEIFIYSFVFPHRYNTALQYLDGLLAVEPQNSQAKELRGQISKRLKDEAVKGAVIGGGVLVGLGALVGLGIALAKK